MICENPTTKDELCDPDPNIAVAFMPCHRGRKTSLSVQVTLLPEIGENMLFLL
jgi:hypothetical protein